MEKNQIIKNWNKGISKNEIANRYKNEYNQQIKINRSQVRHRKDGKFISKKEALNFVETIIYEYIKKINKK